MLRSLRSLILVTLTVVIGNSVCFATYTASYASFFGSTSRTWGDVTKMSDGTIAVANKLSGRGKILTVTIDPVTGAYQSFADTGFDSSIAADGLAYLGNVAGDDQFYLNRNYNISGVGYGHVEKWGTTSGWDLTGGNLTQFWGQYPAILGSDMMPGGDAGNYAIVQITVVALISGSTKTELFFDATMSLSGVSPLSDINGDGVMDYVFSGADSLGASSLYVLTSGETSYSVGTILGTAMTDKTWTGVTNMGDIDGDGLLELVACRNEIVPSLGNSIDLVQTNIAIPEPATMCLLAVGFLGLRFGKRR